MHLLKIGHFKNEYSCYLISTFKERIVMYYIFTGVWKKILVTSNQLQIMNFIVEVNN